MSQPLSQGMQRKLGIEPDADKVAGREYELPPKYERLRKGKRTTGATVRFEEADGEVIESQLRDIIALMLILFALCLILTGVVVLWGPWVALIVAGAYTAILGVLLAVL